MAARLPGCASTVAAPVWREDVLLPAALGQPAAYGRLGRQGAAEEEGQRNGENRIAAVLHKGAVSLQRLHGARGAALRRTARRRGHSVAVFRLTRKLAVLM